MMSRMTWIPGLLLCAGLLQAEPQVVERAVFAKSLKDDRSAAEETASFRPGDTVNLSIELKGRPKGTLAARFFFREEMISQTKVDLAAETAGEPEGARAHVAFSLKPREPFPVGDLYHVVVLRDGQEEGRYLFRIDPPEGAIPSKLEKVALTKAKAEDWAAAVDEVAVAADDTVWIGGSGDFGTGSWLEATWITNGEPVKGGVQSLTWSENKKAAKYEFQRRPEGGWKAGRHEVVLRLDGAEVARKLFSVRAATGTPGAAAVGAPPVLRKAALHRDEKGSPGGETASFSPSDRIFHFVCDLEATVPSAAGEVVWTLVTAEGGLKNVAMARSPFSVKSANRLTGRFVAARELPAGSYRVEMTLGGRVFATRDFQVK